MSLTIPDSRRIIGPIPPRDPRSGKLLLKPHMGKRVKLNSLGEAVRDEAGQPIEETADLRDPREYMAWELGQEPAENATKGMRLFQVDLKGEPLVRVYARDEEGAVKVFKREMGIQRLGADDPRVTEVAAS